MDRGGRTKPGQLFLRTGPLVMHPFKRYILLFMPLLLCPKRGKMNGPLHKNRSSILVANNPVCSVPKEA